MGLQKGGKGSKRETEREREREREREQTIFHEINKQK
jgi:hypothetical protein